MNTRAARKTVDLSVAGGLETLEELIRSRLSGSVREFALSVEEKGIVLRGRVCTYHAKQLALHAVMEATDLPIAANNIEVSRPG
jgi:hypothetical protein